MNIVIINNQSINQSLFQAEAHRTNNQENANTGNRTEQTHRRIQVKKLPLKTSSSSDGIICFVCIYRVPV